MNELTGEYRKQRPLLQRVAQAKIPQGMFSEVFKCIPSITHHVNEPIQIKDVADHIDRSRSCLTNRFK